MKKVVVGFLAGLALALAGGIAFAGIPDQGGVIHTCYDSAGKLWRPIDTTREGCKPGEVSLSFNQKGPKGDMGLQGPAGAPGASMTPTSHWSAGVAPVHPNDNLGRQVDCPSGKKPVSGGYSLNTTQGEVDVVKSFAQGNGWYVYVINHSNYPILLDVQVVCV